MLIDDLVKPHKQAETKSEWSFSYRPGTVVAVILIVLAVAFYAYQNLPKADVRTQFPPDLNALDRQFTGENQLTPEQIKERNRQFVENDQAISEISDKQTDLRNNHFDTND